MRKNLLIACLLFGFSYLSNGQELLNAIKGKKTRETAKEANAHIPNAAQWTEAADKLIAEHNIDGLLNLQWTYKFIEVYGYGENDFRELTTMPVNDNTDPLLFGGSEELYKKYFVAVGAELAENGHFDFVMTAYLDSTDQQLFGSDSSTPLVQALFREINERFKTKGSGFEHELAIMLANESVDLKRRQIAAENMIYYCYRNDLQANDELNDAIFPYFETYFVNLHYAGPMTLEYWARINYTKATPVILKMLSSEVYDLRYSAILAAGQMHLKEALPKLRIIAEKDGNYYVDDYGNIIYHVRNLANDAIQKIELAE